MARTDYTLAHNPYYEGSLLALAIIAVLLNIYAFFLIVFQMPKTMYDFRPCLCMLCVLDGLFAFFLGVVIDVTFQFPALAGVIKGPIIMFLYRYVGYDGCKVIVCSTFTFMAGIVYFQNYGINFRFVTIHPNKKLYDMYNSKKALFAIYVGGLFATSTIGIAIYILMYPESEIAGVVANYPNSTDIFIDYVPGKNLLMAANPFSPVWYFIFAFVTVGVLIAEVGSYTMFFIALKLLTKFASSFSKETLKMQRQFLWLLAIQATTPLAFIVIPVLCLVYQITFDIPEPKLQTELGMLWIGLYSNVNACLTIFFISPFRKFTKKYTVDIVMKMLGIKPKVTPLFEIQATSSLNFNSRAM